MDGLNEHLKAEHEREAQLAGAKTGGGSGSMSGGSSQDVPVTGDIVGFAGVKLEE